MKPPILWSIVTNSYYLVPTVLDAIELSVDETIHEHARKAITKRNEFWSTKDYCPLCVYEYYIDFIHDKNSPDYIGLRMCDACHAALSILPHGKAYDRLVKLIILSSNREIIKELFEIKEDMR